MLPAGPRSRRRDPGDHRDDRGERDERHRGREPARCGAASGSRERRTAAGDSSELAKCRRSARPQARRLAAAVVEREHGEADDEHAGGDVDRGALSQRRLHLVAEELSRSGFRLRPGGELLHRAAERRELVESSAQSHEDVRVAARGVRMRRASAGVENTWAEFAVSSSTMRTMPTTRIGSDGPSGAPNTVSNCVSSWLVRNEGGSRSPTWRPRAPARRSDTTRSVGDDGSGPRPST